MSDGPYSIGSVYWPGLSKLTEEAGEVVQVCGKVMGTGGVQEHWDGTNLFDRLCEEMADLTAALAFFADVNLTPAQALSLHDRARAKLEQFHLWHRAGDPLP